MANFPLSITLSDSDFKWFLDYCEKHETDYKKESRKIIQDWVKEKRGLGIRKKELKRLEKIEKEEEFVSLDEAAKELGINEKKE